MKSQIFHHEEFGNGVTLIGEQIDSVSSAALSILVSSGVARDKEDQIGCSTLLVEMLQRGGGPYDSRTLTDEFERLGVHRSQSAGIEVSMFSAAMLAEHLPRALDLYGCMILAPHLPADELENSRELALQDLASLEDEPASKVMTLLNARFYPAPFGRSQLGTEEGLRAVTATSMRQHYQDQFLNGRMIISIAGKFDWNEVRGLVEKHFATWNGNSTPIEVPPLSKKALVYHEQKEAAQVQIALAYPSVSYEDPSYYACKVGIAVLSGGMAGRLFVEVREKRGLVYRVSASHSAARGRAAIFASAGTTPAHAEETLQVMYEELSKLKDGITADELDRAKVEMKSGLIMQSESSSSRASAIVNDWWYLGRIRTLQEIRAGIEAVTAEDVAKHFAAHPVAPITLTTLGPAAIEYFPEGQPK